jgi:hypothetical protein
MKIKSFKELKESISGTEMIGSMGPNYGQPVSPNTLTNQDVSMVMSDTDGEMYTQEDFNSLYTQYLAKGGEPLQGFNKQNLNKIIHFLNQNK